MRLFLLLVTYLAWIWTGSFAKECGMQKAKIIDLITSGHNSYPGQFPWHVALIHKKDRIVTEYACGGSLISRSYVLTADHCTKSADENDINVARLIVLLGSNENNLAATKHGQHHLVYEIHRIGSNDEWKGLKNDIALLALTSNVQFTDFIQPICLNSLDISNRDTGMVAGWGRTEEGKISEVLKAASMPIISPFDCLASDRQNLGWVLDAGMICAGHQNGTSVCNGDSGSGLVIKRCTPKECYWSLVGIVAFAARDQNGYCRSDGYAAFTSIQKYLPWIKQTTKEQFEEDSSHDLCGLRQDGSDRAKWPWHGTVHCPFLRSTRDELNKTEAFGVTILTNQFVISTMLAYLLYIEAPEEFKVRFGHPSIGNSDSMTQELFIQAAFANTQDRTDPRSLALFKLKGQLHFTKYVQPICLWREDSTLDKIVKQTSFMPSFGRFNPGDRSQEIALPIVSKADCIQDHEEFEDIFRVKQTLCAGAKNGLGPELLDIGTGLVLRSGNTWFLRGMLFMAIADEAETCTDKNHYYMFLDVTHFTRWITATIENSS